MDTAEVMRLVAAAQQGAADDVRRVAEARMVECGGHIEAGPAGLHFVRAVAFYAEGNYRGGVRGRTQPLSPDARGRGA